MGDVPTTPPPFTGVKVINGFKWPPIICDDAPQGLRKFNVRDDDVFVVTYPKSGTHWVMEIMKNILCEGDSVKIKKEYCDTPEVPIEYLDLYKKCNDLTTERPRILMTHAPVDVLPKEVFEGKGKVVFVMRNPKDTVVSFWHFVRERRFLEEYLKWESFLRAFLQPDMVCGNWFDINLSYYEHRNDNNFMFLTYEELKLDHKGCVIRLSDFVSRPLSDDVVERVVQNTTFSHMKTVYSGTLPHQQDVAKLFPNKRDTLGSSKQKFTVMRKGVVGDWKTHFTVAENDLFDEVYNDRMKGSHLAKRMIFAIDDEC